jgi:hypothetical protein
MEAFQRSTSPSGNRINTRDEIREIYRRLNDLSKAQQKLAVSRKQLLVRKEAVRISSTELDSKQLEARNTEANFMNVVREFYHEHMDLLPPPLSELYGRMEILRSEIGELQEDHAQSERVLVGTEWAFMDQEEEVYQFQIEEIMEILVGLESRLEIEIAAKTTSPPLPPQPPPPPPNAIDIAVKHQTHVSSFLATPLSSSSPPSETADSENSGRRTLDLVTAKLSSLRKKFDMLRFDRTRGSDTIDILEHVEESRAQDQSDGSTKQEYSEVLEQIMAYQVELQRLKEKQLRVHLLCAATQSRNSEPDLRHPHLLGHKNQWTRACTESAIPFLLEDTSTKSRIRIWLLDHLRENPLQKALYRNIFESYVTKEEVGDYEHLTEKAEDFWDHDSLSGRVQKEGRATTSFTRDTKNRHYLDEDVVTTFQARSQEPKGNCEYEHSPRVKNDAGSKPFEGRESVEPRRPDSHPTSLPTSVSGIYHARRCNESAEHFQILEQPRSVSQTDTGYDQIPDISRRTSISVFEAAEFPDIPPLVKSCKEYDLRPQEHTEDQSHMLKFHETESPYRSSLESMSKTSTANILPMTTRSWSDIPVPSPPILQRDKSDTRSTLGQDLESELPKHVPPSAPALGVQERPSVFPVKRLYCARLGRDDQVPHDPLLLMASGKGVSNMCFRKLYIAPV